MKYALDWARSVGDGRYLLGAAMYTEFCREDQVESFVAMACETVGWAKLEVTSAAGRRFQVVFGLDGYLLLHATAGDLLWRNGVQELTEQLERFAPVLDYAAVCRSDYGTLSLNDTLFFGGRRPEWLGGDPSSTHFVFKTYVPDILGVQLLGSGHDQLGPQDEWDVKFLEGGKRIESARDLELWFAQDDGPAGEVAERARSSNMNAVYTFQRWYEREMLIASKH
ncbi:hypothetical protein [Arthrobacter sp. NPDC093139]|uniref:hypothetical protein n=1 Tax=Arthrobacter sp. NPDC093139 TaxID=3363945 RepID=UPI0037FD250B